jgi:putative protease
VRAGLPDALRFDFRRQAVPLGDRKYLLSPQDLAGLEVLPELVRAGVASLKIEGRLKSPEYVANITRIYRKALDQLWRASYGSSQFKTFKMSLLVGSPLRKDRYEMEMAFSRGLYTGWFGGTNNQQLVHARFGKKRGVFSAKSRKSCATGLVKLARPAQTRRRRGLRRRHPDEKEEGGRIYEIRKGRACLQFQRSLRA